MPTWMNDLYYYILVEKYNMSKLVVLPTVDVIIPYKYMKHYRLSMITIQEWIDKCSHGY